MSFDGLLGGFQFLRPWWLLALLLLPALPWLWRRMGTAAGGWSRIVDAHLLAAQLQRGRVARTPLVLAMVACALAVLALSGPSWRQAPQLLSERDAALALVLEVSESMRAQDLAPDRLARARFALTDLLRDRKDGQFALVAYAGAAFTVAPVTDDGTTLLALLDALDPSQMPVPGADAAAALLHAAELLENAGHAQGEILLLADGADEDAREAAARVRERGYSVSVLGVGTEAGAPVALPEGGFLKDARGEILVPSLQAEALAAVARAGGGRYATLQPGRSGAAALLSTRGGRYADSEDASQQRVDDGPWLVLLLLPLVALAFRRGWLGCWALGLLTFALLPQPARALDWASLWQRDDQRAWEALQAGEPGRAAALARSPALRGAALYRAGEAEPAAEAFARAEGADAHYNRGNALARAERFEEALAAYDAALALDPAMEDAVANRKAVQDWLQRQQQQPQPGEGEPQPSEGNQGKEQEGEPQDPGESGQPAEGAGSPSPQEGDAEPRPGEASGEPGEEDASTPQPDPAQASEEEQRAREQAFEQAMQEALERAGDPAQQGRAEALDPAEQEQRQAVEQWLRRVPDDPGGLLRRKFALEHQRRMREGDGQ